MFNNNKAIVYILILSTNYNLPYPLCMKRPLIIVLYIVKCIRILKYLYTRAGRLVLTRIVKCCKIENVISFKYFLLYIHAYLYIN